MAKCYGAILMAFLVCSCNGTKTTADKAQALTQAELLQGVLPASAYKAMVSAESGKLFKVVPTLIEGTTDEYSNKSIFEKDLTQKQLLTLKTQLNSDLAYDWKQYEQNKEFEPEFQLVLKSSKGNVNLLVDMEQGLVSYINLDGQQLIPVTKDTQKMLKKLIS